MTIPIRPQIDFDIWWQTWWSWLLSLLAAAAVVAFVVQFLLVSFRVVVEVLRRVCLKGSALSTFAILVTIFRKTTSPAWPTAAIPTLPAIALPIPLLVAPTVLRTPHLCDNPNKAEEEQQDETARMQRSMSGWSPRWHGPNLEYGTYSQLPHCKSSHGRASHDRYENGGGRRPHANHHRRIGSDLRGY